MVIKMNKNDKKNNKNNIKTLKTSTIEAIYQGEYLYFSGCSKIQNPVEFINKLNNKVSI
jgi:hypothetical protein